MNIEALPIDGSTSLYFASGKLSDMSTAFDAQAQAELLQEFGIGTLLNERYYLTQVLGSGGMGLVFLGHDQRLDRKVAIKIIPQREEKATEARERLLEREAKLGAGLNHPNVATVYDFGLHGKRAYAVFEFVEGETLRSVVNRRGRLSLEEVSHLVETLARALDFAHSKGIVHRDLKPENICFTPQGDFKILDLGVAHNICDESLPGVFFGTPAYSSPEQAKSLPLEGKSDQYALALIAFELLTGKRPFYNKNPVALLNLHISEPPPKITEFVPDIPESVESALLQALAKSPQQRFACCRDFAHALKGQSTETVALRHLIPIRTEERIAFFLSHVSEHFLTVRDLTQRLEAEGLRCWYYERDALPEIPYQRQARTALARSATAVVFVSKQSLRSRELLAEVEDAYKLGCRIIPFFVDSTADDLKAVGSNWQIFLASEPSVVLHRQNQMDEIVRTLVEASATLGIERTIDAAGSPLQRPRIEYYSWATDAHQLDISDLRHVVFHNELVDEFLQMRNKYFLAATKGLGKTLLLTYKRQLLAESAQGQTLTMIPEGRPYLDLMDELRQLPKGYALPLSDLSTTKRIWSAALRISAVSHHPALIDSRKDGVDLEEFTPVVRKWLSGRKIEPSVVFRELTSLSLSNLNQTLNRTENFLAKKMRAIHSGTYFFIDKVDQAIRGLSPAAWTYVQAGLIEAAWDMMNSNRHIRVFATIRQEAFSNYESDIKSNLFGATTNLQYSDDDLAQMMDQLANCYEGCQSFNEFVGFDVIRNPLRPSPEDCLQFVSRHTFGRPRDLVLIASELSGRRASLNEVRLGEIVHHLSATALVNNIFSEVAVLLDCMGDEEQRARFFRLLPQSILSLGDAIRVCEQFNGLSPDTLREIGIHAAEIFHPFRDLYIAGLLGVIKRDPQTEQAWQRFRQPHDYLQLKRVELPASEYYLLHPALNRYLTMVRQPNDYLPFQHLTVGQGLPWSHTNGLVMDVERLLFSLGSTALRELVHRVLNLAQTISTSGNPQLLRFEVETSADWAEFLKHRHESGFEEILLILDELLSAGSRSSIDQTKSRSC